MLKPLLIILFSDSQNFDPLCFTIMLFDSPIMFFDLPIMFFDSPIMLVILPQKCYIPQSKTLTDSLKHELQDTYSKKKKIEISMS